MSKEEGDKLKIGELRRYKHFEGEKSFPRGLYCLLRRWVDQSCPESGGLFNEWTVRVIQPGWLDKRGEMKVYPEDWITAYTERV